MKTLVIYKSKTGFTKKYAEWISEALSADLLPASETSGEKLLAYDCIIFGGRVFATGIDGLSLIKKNLEALKGKKLVIFATGISPAEEEFIELLKSTNFSPDELELIDFYYFRGGFNHNGLPFVERLLMSALRKRIGSKEKKGAQLTAEEQGILELCGDTADYTDKSNIDEMLNALLQLS